MSSSDVGCCGYLLLKAHLKEFLSNAVGRVLHKTKVEITSDESWSVRIKDRFQGLKKKKI